MIILGISDSHEAHACLLVDGKLVSAVAEERFTRLKADQGYPKKSIEYVLNNSKINIEDIDIFVFAGQKCGLFHSILKPSALFTVDDWLYQNEKYWKPTLIEKQSLSPLDDFNILKNRISNIEENPYYALAEQVRSQPEANPYDLMNKIRIKTLVNHLGIEENKISFIRHEECHQYYGYFSQNNFKSNALVFTLEGGGDDSSATVSIGENEIISEKYKTNESMIGRLYRYITLLLGMKPNQHEYKVMGLAPYGTFYHGEKSLNHFRKFDKVENGQLINQKIFSDVYYSSKKMLEGQRFDGIAWGLQTYLEETLEKWVVENISKYRINDVIVSGGVAQNIKAMQVLIKNNNVKSVWAGPISGDGSLAIGAAWSIHKKMSTSSIEGLKTIYLGSEMSKNDIDIELKKISGKYHIIENYTNRDVANWLSEGYIIARCEGRMEFGQRALGNRSILADPRKHDTVERINKKIKYRDFWMPFTPTICFEDCNKYLVNKKNIDSPFMTMAYDLQEGLAKKLPAVIHPADKTCRPQMLKKTDNEEYYNIIKEFEKISGHPVLLNTSFNLHGDAIVEKPIQAIETFNKSDLDILLIGGKAIFRNLEYEKK